MGFPENYQAENLAGKDAVFDVKIHKIFEVKTPKIDDELAKKAGFDSLDKMKEDIKKRIGEEFDNMTFGDVKKDLLDKLAKQCEFDVPQSLFEQEFSTIWKQIEESKKNKTLDPEDAKKSEKELKKDYENVAKRRIRLGLLLADIGKKNNIQVTNEEINNLIRQEIMRYPDQKDNIVKFYQENPEMLANLQGPLFEDKVVKFVLEKADVKTNELTAEEFFKKNQSTPVKKKAATKKKAGAEKTSEKPAAKTKTTKKKATTTAK